MYIRPTDKAIAMVREISNKHVGEIDYLELDWVVLDLFDKYGEIYQQAVPKLTIGFKG